MELFKLVWRNLARHRLRSFLTVASLIVALFLLCALRSLITTLASGTEAASSSRLIVQSAVSLYVDLPLSYQQKIAGVEGVERLSKWQWFGGYYKNERNRFAQFAVDPEETLAIYPEMEIVEGSKQAFEANRRGCLIGEGLVDKYDIGLGDTFPLIGEIFPHPDGPDVAWEFQVDAIYRPTQRNFDPNMLLFHWDYFEETQKSASGEPPGVGTFAVKLEEGADATAVMAQIDALFANGPQRVQATSESEFQAQFVSMLGNVPGFLTTIGGGVLAAILLAVVNTMLMAGREQTRDVGILKALGFSDGAAVRLLVAQALFLCVVGGGLGIALAKFSEPGMAKLLGTFFPGYRVEALTLVYAVVLILAVGLFAGAVPAWRAGRLRTVDALRGQE